MKIQKTREERFKYMLVTITKKIEIVSFSQFLCFFFIGIN